MKEIRYVANKPKSLKQKCLQQTNKWSIIVQQMH